MGKMLELHIILQKRNNGLFAQERGSMCCTPARVCVVSVCVCACMRMFLCVNMHHVSKSYPNPGKNHAQASVPGGVNRGGYPHSRVFHLPLVNER